MPKCSHGALNIHCHTRRKKKKKRIKKNTLCFPENKIMEKKLHGLKGGITDGE